MVSIVKLDGLDRFVKKLLPLFRYKVILLKGELGAGKTTLVKQLAKELGCIESISSPTFGIANELMIGDKTGYHLDLYRINTPDELIEFGFEEYVSTDRYCFIEWPEIAMSYIPNKHHVIAIKTVDHQTRQITFI